MGSKGIAIGLTMVLVIMLSNRAAAQSGCTSVLIGLAPCLNYITGNSSTPSSSCCSNLGSVVQSQPQCLCSLLNNGAGATLGIAINQTLALSLPGACNVQTPPVSKCDAANGPTPSAAGSPASSPTDSPSDETPAVQTAPWATDIPTDAGAGGAGSKTVPSTDGTTSAGSKISSTLHFVAFLLFVASFASTSTKF